MPLKQVTEVECDLCGESDTIEGIDVSGLDDFVFLGAYIFCKDCASAVLKSIYEEEGLHVETAFKKLKGENGVLQTSED